MILRIPEAEIDSVAELFALSDQDRNTLLDSLRQVEPGSPIDGFIGSIGKLSDLSGETLFRLLSVLLNLCNTAHAVDSNIDSFVRDDLAPAFASTGDVRLQTDGPQWEKVRSFLTEALGTNWLSVSVKARNLVLSESHLFLSARIVSDLRLVFAKDPLSLPSAGMVLHSLKLNYLADREEAVAEFVLDREDLLKLNKVIERALVKDQTLAKVLQQAKVRKVTPFAGSKG